MIHFWHWLLDFMGINNTYDSFSTHMYNFWSGFGGGLIQFSLLGALVAMYRHYLAHNKVVDYMLKKNPIVKIEEKISEEKSNKQ